VSRYRIEVDTKRCQSYGSCLNLAPKAFAWDARRKVRITDAAGAADAVLLKAAKLCPYRAIGVIDAATGLRVFPRWTFDGG